MTSAGPWTTADFESMSWHDVHVHGFRFDRFNESNGSADLVLDIDYILKWERSGENFLFTVCRADLRFTDVFGLKVDNRLCRSHRWDVSFLHKWHRTRSRKVDQRASDIQLAVANQLAQGFARVSSARFCPSVDRQAACAERSPVAQS